MAPAGAQPEGPLGDTRLDALATRYFNDEWRLNPIDATRAGVHDYDDKLGSFSSDGFDERLDLARRYLDSVKAIDPGTMGAEATYDAQILESRLESTILQLGTLERWRHDPALYARAASNGVYGLLARDFAPLPGRVRSVVAREKQIPGMLQDAQSNLTTVDAVTAQLAREDVAGAIEFFSASVPVAVAPLRDASLKAQFASANATAVAALRAYLAALEARQFAHPSGTFARRRRGWRRRLRPRRSMRKKLRKPSSRSCGHNIRPRTLS